jgi:Xaa-Pro aminopeptidase
MARDSLAAAGLGDQFIHGLGHGVGILIHEAPSLGKTAEEPLLAGQVVTVEPGIYVEGWGGIRIEDLCVVRDAGLEILSAAPK